MREEIIDSLWKNVEALRERRPLIHNITNLVVTEFSANALLCLGASPLMSHALEEQKEIVAISDALILNIGTLDSSQIESMYKAIEFANNKEIPIIIDPVGAGASKLRTETALSLLERAHKLILKGNASEVLALSNQNMESKGVDSSHSSDQAVDAAKHLIETYNIQTVAISGKEDLIIDKSQSIKLSNGSATMAKVTGTGCVLTATIGPFCTTSESVFAGVRNAVAFYGVCGELAAKQANGPGSFKPAFLDKLQNITKEEIQEFLVVEKC